jgi:hypothetical protein
LKDEIKGAQNDKKRLRGGGIWLHASELVDFIHFALQFVFNDGQN